MRVAPEAPLINRNESWIRNPAGAFGIWDRWVASTGVPVHEGYFVPDMRTIELGWWEERKCNAAFLKLAGFEGLCEARVTEIPPSVERAETLSNAGITAASQRDWEKALSQMREAIEVCAGCSSLPKLRKNLGLTECQAGKFADCERNLREALTDLPGDPEIRKALDLLGSMKRP